ncbi:MAG: hypothetical protein ACREWE_07475, partial [Gammaproteobacteria bacterium]
MRAVFGQIAFILLDPCLDLSGREAAWRGQQTPFGTQALSERDQQSLPFVRRKTARGGLDLQELTHGQDATPSVS